MFPIGLVEKDFHYVIDAARSSRSEVPTSTAVRDVYQRAIRAGLGENNIAGVAKLFG